MAGKEKVINFLRTAKRFERVVSKIKILSAGDGFCRGKFKIEPEHTDYMGRLHGGFSATLVDVISSMAFYTHERGDGAYVSTNIDMNFCNSAKIGDEVIVDAKTLQTEKNLAFLEVDIKNELSGELLVKGFHTVYLLTKR